MALKLELNMKLSQQLVMTPQLQMAIKLLQMTQMELNQMVANELVENPTLDENEDENYIPDPPTVDNEGNGQEQAQPVSDLGDSDQIVAHDLQKTLDEAQPKQPEMDWDNYFESYIDGPSDIMPRDTGGEDRPGFEEFYAKESTLYDYLMWQLKFSTLPRDLQDVGEEIIGNINDDGYMADIGLEDLAHQMERPLKEIERVHQVVLRFDPLGIGARDLREALFVQSRFGENRHALASQMIEKHWNLVAKRNIPRLVQTLKVSRAEVEEAMRAITRLDPKPGAKYSNGRAEYITPDIYVYKIGDDYTIVLNEDGLPRLRVNQYYQRALQDKSSPTETRDYIKGKLRSASWLIRSIQQRQRTIYKVAESIISKQREFLDEGVDRLKPMVLRDVAEDIGMHECTVSRVTTNKYMHTPQGIFELKYFFNSGIVNSEGEGIASETIRTKIRQLVEKEEPRKPLSDQKLVSLLKADGVDVARRTVAKYRESMGILSSSGRRKTF